jgi:hypothetical protein
MSAPNWGEKGSAITSNGNSYITIDGGTAGTIQATSNGTGQATTFDENGVSVYGCSNCVIRSLTVANLYVHTYTPTDENGQNTTGIYVANGSNVSIYNNIVHDMKWCVFYGFNEAGNSNVAIYSNHAYNCDHGIVVGSGDPDAALAGASVYGNTIYDGYGAPNDRVICPSCHQFMRTTQTLAVDAKRRSGKRVLSRRCLNRSLGTGRRLVRRKSAAVNIRVAPKEVCQDSWGVATPQSRPAGEMSIQRLIDCKIYFIKSR